MRTAMGLIAGPESPAVTLAMRGLRVSGSMAMATNVLMTDSASAPASCATYAICAMLVTLGRGPRPFCVGRDSVCRLWYPRSWAWLLPFLFQSGQMGVEPVIGLADELAVEALLAAP